MLKLLLRILGGPLKNDDRVVYSEPYRPAQIHNVISEKLCFTIRNDHNEPYYVEFYREGDNLTATCDCRAGENKMQCKHRVRLLLGDTTKIIEGHENMAKLQRMMKGSDVEQALMALLEAEAKMGEFTTKTEASKYRSIYSKALAKTFND